MMFLEEDKNRKPPIFASNTKVSAWVVTLSSKNLTTLSIKATFVFKSFGMIAHD